MSAMSSTLMTLPADGSLLFPYASAGARTRRGVKAIHLRLAAAMT